MKNLEANIEAVDDVASPKRTWSAPAVEALAPLRELTLQSPIPGGEGGFSWLDVSDSARRLG